MRIAQLELQSVGVFEHQVIDFREKTDPDKAEIHILAGVNGSGKSTILYTLASAFFEPQVVQRRFYDINSSKANVTYVNSTPNTETVTIAYVNGRHLDFQNYPPVINSYNTKVRSDFRALQHQELDFAVFAYSGARSLSSIGIGSITELTDSPLSNSLNFQTSVNPQVLIQWIANTKAKVAFARQDHNAEVASHYEESIRRIEDAIHEIVGYRVEFVFNYEPLAVIVKVRNQELEFDLLPDGLKSIISWIADLLMRLDRLKWVNDTPVLDRNFILFLDEIEIHLHPAWQRRILPVVQKLFKNAQIFIATHSPFVVASVSDAWVYKFVLKDGKSVLASVEESMAGSSYTTVLDEIFGIDEYFDVETEAQFDKFAKLKKEFLSGKTEVREKLLDVAKTLSEKGTEVQDIVGRELRQIERITQQSLAL